MTDLLDRLAHAPDSFLLFVAVMMVVALWVGFSGFRRCRQIEDVPTARVRSAHQGYVELVGTARMLSGDPIVAPLSGTACCWFQYKVEQRGDKNWRLLQSGRSDGIFALNDSTGDCVIDPEGAEVTTRHKSVWHGDGSGMHNHAVHARLPSLGKAADTLVGISERLFSGLGSGDYRYTESVILDGDPLYAIGQFHTHGAGDMNSTIRELTGAILREWKQRPETLRERFDRNRDGRIDTEEWERARTVARKEAVREHAEELRRDQLHTLVKPTGGRYFLLSNLEEFDLLRRYRSRKRLGFGFFLVLGSMAAFMLSSKL